MRKVLSFFILFQAIFFFSCKKSDTLAKQNSIVGKWQLRDYYYSTGGPAIAKTANPAHISTIEFDANGNLTYSDSLGVRSYHYEILDSARLWIGTSSDVERYKLTDTLLSLYPPCYEPCGSNYVPVK